MPSKAQRPRGQREKFLRIVKKHYKAVEGLPVVDRRLELTPNVVRGMKKKLRKKGKKMASSNFWRIPRELEEEGRITMTRGLVIDGEKRYPIVELPVPA